MNWREIALEHSDEKLYQIMINAQDYSPDALSAFSMEFDRRGLDREKVKNISTVISEEKVIRASSELTIFQKLRLIWRPFSFLYTEQFRHKGEDIKYKQSYKYMAIGWFV